MKRWLPMTLALAFVVLALWGVNAWRSLVMRGAAVAAQRAQLTADIKSRLVPAISWKSLWVS